MQAVKLGRQADHASLKHQGKRGLHKTARPVAYLHIPKNGGTSVDDYLKRNWRPECTEVDLYKVQPHDVPSLNQAECTWAHVLVGPGVNQSDILREYATCHGLRLKFLTGHLSFGSCHYLKEGCEYATVLREPLDRMLSHYKYLWKRHPQAFEHCNPHCDTFEGYLDAIAAGSFSFYGISDHQTRFLAGEEYDARVTTCGNGKDNSDMPIKPLRSRSQLELFGMAKKNLVDSVPIIGFLEDLPTFQALMQIRYKYTPTKITHFNKSPGLSLSDLSNSTIQRMRQLQFADLEIYDFAQKLMAERIKSISPTILSYARQAVASVQ
jgi:hypothetical protein